MKRSLTIASLAAWCIGPWLFATDSQAADQPAHVILVMTDDQGYGDLGYHGNPIVKTPHLDAIAENSARLPTFVVSPVCTPTRASLMTGRYNYRTRAVDTFKGRAMMEPDERTIAEILAQQGFATGLFGKWHLGDNYPLRPMDQGFEEVLGHLGGGLAQASDHWDNRRRYTDAILYHNGKKFQSEGYCTDVYFDAAIQWIRKAHTDGRPSFTYIATNAPHAPWHDVPQQWYAHYRKQTINAETLNLDQGYPNHLERRVDADTLARYYAMISNIDDNLGRLIAALKEIDVLDNTLLIFLTDNGPAPNGYSAGLRGKKTMVYEGGIRSPFFVHWPARLTAGDKSPKLAAHIDIMPTILDAVGLKPPSDRTIDGRSLLPLLETNEKAIEAWPDRAIVLQSHRGNVPSQENNFCVRTDRWKLVRASGFRHEKPSDNAPFELFDLSVDPYEQHDVADKNPKVVADLKNRYQKWFHSVSSTRENNYAPPRIVVGSSEEPVTVLSRQDRRESGAKDNVGHWLLDVRTAEEYRVDFVLLDPIDQGTVEVTIGNQTQKRPLSGGAVPLQFVNLAAGPQRLVARIRMPSGDVRGVDYVTIRRP